MFKFCRGLVVFTHLKIAAVTLAGILIIWGFVLFGHSDSLFVQYLDNVGVADEWGAALFLNGIILLGGCLCPHRSLRHIGLALCCFQMFALGGFFFELGLFSPVTVLMPYLGLMSLITLMAEVKGKPRNVCS
jgi:hypothetical protein